MESTLTPDTQAVLLLCGELGQRDGNGPKPLGLRQYNALASWLKIQGLRPGDLLSRDGTTRLTEFQSPAVDPIRLTHLLESRRRSCADRGEVGEKRTLGDQSE